MQGEAAAVRRIPIRSKRSPHEALLAVRDEPYPFALLGRWAGGGAIVGCRPLALAGPGEDPFALLDRLPAPRGDRPGGMVGGGWFGWLGYALGGRVERLPPAPPRPAQLPEAHLAYHDHVLRLDPDGRWWFEALVTPGRERDLDRRLADLRRRMAAPPGRAEPAEPGPFRFVPPAGSGHLAAVRECRERIHAGEAFQANLSLRFEASWGGDLASLFARAAGALEPAYGAAFLAPWGGVASMSPELFLRRRERSVETAPIKGTISRPDDETLADSALGSLLGSAKDGAEHVMIVDLMRNDLGRVCEFGSIRAPGAPDAEAHPGVWHLVSRVRGQLREGTGNAELLRAAFPPGSVTGAPKVQAMKMISDLEPTGREVFTGAVGYSSPLAGLELNVAIRTFEARGNRLWLHAGGGVVAESDPVRELEECVTKAQPLVHATGSTIEAVEPAPRPRRARDEDLVAGLGHPPPRPSRALREGRTRPDPALGLIETILVRDGHARCAQAHLARLTASLEALHGASPPDDLPDRLAAAARTAAGGGLRLTAGPDGRVRIARVPIPRRPLPVRLGAVMLPGGLGAHKWADRRLVDALAGDGLTPLLVDADGAVLEAGWANVWIVEGGRMLTPPADGRILPGITRGAMLAGGSAEGLATAESEISLERLHAADAVLLSASLSGLVRGSLCVSGPMPRGHPGVAGDPNGVPAGPVVPSAG